MGTIYRDYAGHKPFMILETATNAFGGNKAAIKRVDKNITWLGGIDAPAGHPGTVATVLKPGSYLATDQNSNAISAFDVVSSTANYRTLYPNSFVTTKGNEFHPHTSLALPKSGWVKFHNNAEEPHMFVFQHVKQSTTNKDVQDYIASGSQQQPSWGLQPSPARPSLQRAGDRPDQPRGGG